MQSHVCLFFPVFGEFRFMRRLYFNDVKCVTFDANDAPKCVWRPRSAARAN